MKIGRQTIALLDKEVLLPQAPGTAVVVIPRNDIYRNRELSNRAADLRDNRLVWGWGIEKIARDHNERRAVLGDQLPEPPDGVDALPANQRAFVSIIDAGEGLSKLPIGCVKKSRNHDQMMSEGTHYPVTMGMGHRSRQAKTKGY